MDTKSQSDNSQHARFVEKARELGCDESEKAFDEKLRVIARHKPKTKKEDADSAD